MVPLTIPRPLIRSLAPRYANLGIDILCCLIVRVIGGARAKEVGHEILGHSRENGSRCAHEFDVRCGWEDWYYRRERARPRRTERDESKPLINLNISCTELRTTSSILIYLN